MQPLLYPADTTQDGFKNNGLGFFNHCTECAVTEERNGIYELSMTVLRSDRLSDRVGAGMFIKTLANPFDDPQIFEIYQTSIDDKQIKINAQHIKYIANGNVLTETGTMTGTPSDVWEQVSELLAFDNVFSFSSDITTTATMTAAQDRPVRLGDVLGGVDGSFLDTYGGEYKFDNFKISLLKNRGRETGVCLRYGSNISSFLQESNINTMYSHIYGYAYLDVIDSNGKSQDYQLAVSTALINLQNTKLYYNRVLAYDFGDKMRDDKIIVPAGGGGPINWAELVSKLTNITQAYANSNITALTDLSTTITIDIADTLRGLSECKLCDTILIYFEPLNITAKAKIVATEFDAINERYTKLQIGTVKKTIVDLLNVKNIGGV